MDESIGLRYSALVAENERLRADLADCRMLLGKYGDTAQELREACDEKQQCIDSSVAAQRDFLADIDALRAELAELRKGPKS